MKLHLKNFTLKHYLRHVRRQNKHIQHLHALAFAGIITALIAGVILYADYGFWHETYRSDDLLVEMEEQAAQQSEDKSFGNFLMEAKARFNSIGSAGAGFFEGKESYTKDSK